MQLRFATGVLLVVAVIFGGVFLTGCEEEGEEQYELTISPSETSLTGESNTVVFAVSAPSNTLNRTLSLPLEWSVSDTSLGNILESEGYTAIYGSTGKAGINIITAQDQYGSEGIAAVTQN